MLAVLAAALGACLHSAGGFGFALVLAPALVATLEPSEAVTALLVLGVLVNLLVLAGERRALHVRTADLGPLLAAAAPGLILGALVARALPRPALQVAVGAAVVGAGAVQATLGARSSRPASRTRSRRSAWPVGFLAGILTTSTTVNGPPLLLWLQGRGASAHEVRVTLAAGFLCLNVAGAAALAAVAGGGGGLDLGRLAPLLPAIAVGHLLGRAIFARLTERRFRALALGLVLATGSASLASGLAALSS